MSEQGGHGSPTQAALSIPPSWALQDAARLTSLAPKTSQKPQYGGLQCAHVLLWVWGSCIYIWFCQGC